MELLTLVTLFATVLLRGQTTYQLGPESQPQPATPKGGVTKHVLHRFSWSFQLAADGGLVGRHIDDGTLLRLGISHRQRRRPNPAAARWGAIWPSSQRQILWSRVVSMLR